MTTKKQILTPKAIIHQRFGNTACYEIEEVEESNQNNCPGLSIKQKAQTLYRCILKLPEISVISETCKRKKDAEHSAAEKALQKLGIKLKESEPTIEEAWVELINRVSYFLLSNEFMPSLHPLSSHFRAALNREDPYKGFVPVSVFTIYDTKITNLCKTINPEIESSLLVLQATSKINNPNLFSEKLLSLKRVPETLQNTEIITQENIQIQAILIPFSENKLVESISINISPNEYYLDVIANLLGVTEASKVMISSKSIGKASSETRLYYSASSKASLNVMASYLCNSQVHGDAILASVGYRWKSIELFFEDLSLRAYYRMLVNKIPNGIYKLSREINLASELPFSYTTKSSWRGLFPRDILLTFCRQHHLSEPEFTFPKIPLVSQSCKKLKVESNSGESNVSIRCVIKIFTKTRELILECSPNNVYKKQLDAIQKTALKVVLWFNMLFKNTDMEKLSVFSKEFDIEFHSQQVLKAFMLCPLVNRVKKSVNIRLFEDNLNIKEQENIGVFPSNGSLVCINCSVFLVTKDGNIKEKIESNEEFEFEIGTGGVISKLEGVITQMCVNQSVCFNENLPSYEFILAASDNSEAISSLLESRECYLEYSVSLLKVTEPLEDRMEQALFSPPLSKQRVEYALQHIKQSNATLLVDFGCGSGSLLESLLEYKTSLEKIVGVDISQKGLTRAAKILHSKLTQDSMEMPSYGIKSAILYEGSITSFDSRLYGCDIGTCLEVIEHMEEEEASVFGNIVLSRFCPKVLIVSTPNYEYNPILQKSAPDMEDFEENKTCKFRNHDHKFEWTRLQFNNWASELAKEHDYDVEFSGVGGNGEVEPGFASQIAVFIRKEKGYKDVDLVHCYNTIWEWTRAS